MTVLETRLASPFLDYPLEQLRARFLFAVTSNHDNIKSARVAVQMAFDTEIGAIVRKLAMALPSTLAEVIDTRQRFLDVDVSLRQNRFLVEPALASLSALFIPVPYVNLLRRHLGSDYPRYRVCGVAALLCLAATAS
jgi:hypothetical protein